MKLPNPAILVRRFLVLLLLSALAACEGLGVRDTDPAVLEQQYVDEHSRFLKLAGVRVHVREEGRGPPLVLVHGLNGSLHVWEQWTEQLREHYRVISFDVPPFGLSEPLPNRRYDGPPMAELLEQLFDALELDSVILVGHSLGGYYAAYYAAQAPERVETLVLVAPAAYPQPIPLFLRLANLPVLGAIPELILPRPLVRLGMRTLFADPDRLTEDSVQRQYDMMRSPTTRGESREVTRMLEAYSDVEPQWVGGIDTPVLLMWGEEDTWVPIEQARRWLADLPDARLLRYPDTGHMPMEERPQVSVADLQLFLSSRQTGNAGQVSAADLEELEFGTAGQ